MLLRSYRLLLREYREEDLAALHEFGSDPEVFRYQQFGPRDERQNREFLDRAIARSAEKPRVSYDLAVILKEGATLIGSCRISVADRANGQGTIGYDLHRGYWGRGLGTETAWLLVSYGFDSLKLHRVSARCDPENKASARILEKCGMHLDARLRETRFFRNAWHDQLEYSILEQEWWGVEEH